MNTAPCWPLPPTAKLETKSSLQSPIAALNRFLSALDFKSSLVEWGTPMGSFSRLLPAITAKALNQECLWVTDQKQAQVYPNSWTGLGFDLNNLFFLNEDQPLSSVRSLINENCFPLLIVDSQQKLRASDLHFLAQACRRDQMTIFLFRSYFLSNKNGNPFSRYRINSSYSISQKRFQLSLMKGGPQARQLLSFKEVFCG